MNASKKHYMEQLLGIHFTRDNSVTLLQNGDNIFPAMLKAIRSSQHSIELLTYIYWTGDVAQEFAEALSDRSKNGVDVKVMLDAFGSKEIEKSLVEKMEQAGVQVEWFRKIGKAGFRLDYRTHRKILVCDDAIAFTGGVGIAKEWEGDARNEKEWRETHFQIEGPAVTALRGAFWDNWIENQGIPECYTCEPSAGAENEGHLLQVVRSDSGKSVSDAYKSVTALVSLAEKNLRIITPYFVPDDPLLKEICKSQKRGVNVQIILPGKHIDRRFERIEGERLYDELLNAGVKIFRYKTSMIHTKLIICDESLALFGSVNMNRRSMQKDNEIAVISASESLNRELIENFAKDIQCTNEIEAKTWEGIKPLDRLLCMLRAPLRKQL